MNAHSIPTEEDCAPSDATWWIEAKRVLIYRIGCWEERRKKPGVLPGMTEAEVSAYYLGRQREAEAMIDLLSDLYRGKDVTWAAPAKKSNG